MSPIYFQFKRIAKCFCFFLLVVVFVALPNSLVSSCSWSFIRILVDKFARMIIKIKT